MPRLDEDERYLAALQRVEAMQGAELAAFRKRLANLVVGMAAEAIEGMDTFDEVRVRKALAAYDRVYVEESMRYIERVLVQGGEIELAKRLGETADAIPLDELPEAFQSAHDELVRAGEELA